jgi:hypothetical protein
MNRCARCGRRIFSGLYCEDCRQEMDKRVVSWFLSAPRLLVYGTLLYLGAHIVRMG